ncbi:right-handed parallel beta-helix repeat-containing protein [Mycobacterium sp. 21AC1]|uniref:right-handed parallel beta-helix repeat-containing protein n=1 Tax=[Mycobacterium] appelbergii TaxID=2939269 RepID=UPI002939261B|nr:glycosyl hydrolase family 28-related protein [Mycobacterium sp. 21AC1]MDV3123977.1 right-handed parallel beta-helix repeat-containing protein [Mycobacterium sp. 21AC1]
MAVVDVRSHGATGDGTTDDRAAVLAAVRTVADAGGGTVFFPAGDYALSGTLGDDAGFAKVWLLGDGERAARLLATGKFAPISGRWTESRIENLVIDAGSHGGAGLDVDLDKSYVRHCRVRGWTDHGIRLNATTEGLLNWIDDNFVEQCTGYGIYTTYLFYDSWIVNNNVGSTGPNLSVESGPVRILANHLNGAPQNNIELRGNKSLTIVGNICEGARREAIVYTMPSFLYTDSPQVQIVANNITNGGKGAPGEYPAIGIYSRDEAHRTKGFNVTGNFIANEDEGAGWSYAVDAEYVDDLAVSGNQWDNNGFSVAPVRASGRNVGIAGNTSGNLPARAITTVTEDVVLGAAPGTDYVCLLDRGAEATLPDAAGNTNRYTVRNIAVGATRLHAPTGQEIDGGRHVRLGRSAAVEVISDGTNWWTL